MKSVHVQLTNKARELARVSLVYTYITCLGAYIVVLKVRPKDRPAELTHIRHNEASEKKLDTALPCRAEMDIPGA